MFGQDQRFLDAVSDQYGDTDERDMQCQRIDRSGIDGLPSGRRTFVAGIDADTFHPCFVGECPDIADVTASYGNIDENHAGDNAQYQTASRHRVTQVGACRPAKFCESFRQAADCSMTTFKADFQQIAENIRYVEKRCQQKKDQSQADDILPPGNDLSETELGCGQMPYFFQGCRRYTEKQAGKNDVYQKSRQLAESDEPVR